MGRERDGRTGDKAAGAALLLALASIGSTARAEVLARLETVEYLVQAGPSRSLRETLDAASPIRWNGQPYHGHTRWQVRWSYRWFERGDGRCRLTSVRVELDGTITLPRLAGASPTQQARFDRYLAALRLHELGHYQFGRDAAHEIERGLSALPEMASCGTLSAAADELGRRTLRRHAELERRYDERTGHGLAQGAALD